MKIICHRISIQTLLFQAYLPTRQNGVENHDKGYYLSGRATVQYFTFFMRVSLIGKWANRMFGFFNRVDNQR